MVVLHIAIVIITNKLNFIGYTNPIHIKFSLHVHRPASDLLTYIIY